MDGVRRGRLCPIASLAAQDSAFRLVGVPLGTQRLDASSQLGVQQPIVEVAFDCLSRPEALLLPVMGCVFRVRAAWLESPLSALTRSSPRHCQSCRCDGVKFSRPYPGPYPSASKTVSDEPNLEPVSGCLGIAP